jgi:serine/threonine-protein kinase
VALPSATGSEFHGEIAGLLHGRLRVVALIALAPSLIFLVRHMLEPNRFLPLGQEGLVAQVVVSLILAAVTVVLWRRRPRPLRALRALELVLFGLLAGYFAWLQYLEFHRSLNETSLRLATFTSIVRWFFLIVTYGVFIPNPWRRCALIVCAAAAIPLALTPVAAWYHGRMAPDILDALGDMGTLLLTGVAVAIFGSHRIHVLHERVFEAQQLGQYRLKQRLGSGGMGEVYLAEHRLLRRPCAIKLIRPEQAGDPVNLQRFEREVQAIATLTHWNTVEIYDFGHAEDGTFYYVMEYLPGLSLETLVARYGPLPPARAIHFLRQVCRALREAHGIGLLHRDIKPSNIIACERGGVFDVAKLLDFGLVQRAGLSARVDDPQGDRLTLQGTILGSPPYMSPEQAAGRNELDARSDIYSLGAVAYYLLTGQAPFVRDTAMLMLLAHAYEPVQPLTELRPDVPADLEAVVLRCLHKNPAERFPDADSLEKALAACRDAGRWGEEQAAAWWKERAGRGDTHTWFPGDVSTQVTSLR